MCIAGCAGCCTSVPANTVSHLGFVFDRALLPHLLQLRLTAGGRDSEGDELLVKSPLEQFEEKRVKAAPVGGFYIFIPLSLKCTLENRQYGFSKPIKSDKRIFETPNFGQVGF